MLMQFLRPGLIHCCLALGAVSIGAALAAEGDTTQAQEAPAATSLPAESATAVESEQDGLFSSILKWFTDRKRGTPPERVPETVPTDDIDDVTPSHVFQAATDLLAEIKVLRQAMKVTDDPGKGHSLGYQTIMHAYAKAIEVLEKTARLQKRLGMIPVEVGQPHVINISRRDLQGRILTTIHELRRVKRQLVIEKEIQPTPFVGSKTPSLIYERLADASLLLDGLLGRSTTSNDVYMQVLQVHDVMELFATKLRVTAKVEPPIVDGVKGLKEVAQQILRARYKVVKLQSRLGMDGASTAYLTLERVTQTDVYNATTLLLAEMVRIKVHLNIDSPPAPRRESRNKQPTDVFAQILLVIHNLDLMIEAAGALN